MLIKKSLLLYVFGKFGITETRLFLKCGRDVDFVNSLVFAFLKRSRYVNIRVLLK